MSTGRRRAELAARAAVVAGTSGSRTDQPQADQSPPARPADRPGRDQAPADRDTSDRDTSDQDHPEQDHPEQDHPEQDHPEQDQADQDRAGREAADQEQAGREAADRAESRVDQERTGRRRPDQHRDQPGRAEPRAGQPSAPADLGQGDPGAPAGSPGAARAPRTRPVRVTVELSPMEHRALRRWCAETSAELDLPVVAGAEVFRALLGLMQTRPEVADQVRAELARTGGSRRRN